MTAANQLAEQLLRELKTAAPQVWGPLLREALRGAQAQALSTARNCTPERLEELLRMVRSDPHW